MSSSATLEKTQTPPAEADSDSGEESSPPPPPRREKKLRKSAKRPGKGSSLPLDQLPVSGVEDTAGKALGGVTNALGSVANNAVDQKEQGGGGGKSDTLRLRLDLNLDIEIQLKAKIHGDLELALL